MNNDNDNVRPLKNWSLALGYSGFKLRGDIYNNNRFENGQFIITSSLQDLNISNAESTITFKTKNSVYECKLSEIEIASIDITQENFSIFAHQRLGHLAMLNGISSTNYLFRDIINTISAMDDIKENVKTNDSNDTNNSLDSKTEI